jgi:hypothetical protein
MGATCVLPSVASLTGRAVPLQSFKTLISNPIINEILVHKNYGTMAGLKVKWIRSAENVYEIALDLD